MFEMSNPESVSFYNKITGFIKTSEVLSSPPGITNHNGHPLHYPFIMSKVTNRSMITANTDKII